MKNSAENLRHRYNRYQVYAAVTAVCCYAAIYWPLTLIAGNQTPDSSHWSKETAHAILRHISAGLAFLILLIVSASSLVAIYIRAKRDPDVFRVFRDDFQKENERKAAVAGFITTVCASLLLVCLGCSFPMSMTPIGMLPVLIGGITFTATYCYLERG